MRAVRENYLAAAEPSWAKRISDWQLLGLLNLSAILSPRVFLSDVQLGDNVHIFNSFRTNPNAGLFAQIMTLAQQGVISPLLRDRTIRPHKDNAVIEVNTFSDVFLSWKQLDSPSAWINQEITPERSRFFEALDVSLKDSAIVRYRYGAVKRRFMDDVRAAASSSAAVWFQRAIQLLTLEQRRSYDGILRQEWFSLSDVYEFLQNCGVSEVGLSALLVHGLINEAAYSKEVAANFTGFDTGQESTEVAVWGDPRQATTGPGGTLHRDELLDRASAVIDVPALSLLAMLKADEIVEIRALGRGYFEFAEHFARLGVDSEQIDRQFVRETTQYWESICDYVRLHHASVAMRPRNMALYLRELPWPFSRLSEDTFRFALSLAHETTIGESSVIKELVARTAQFIFLMDRDEMKTLRSVLPRSAWSKDRLPGLRSG